MRAFLLFASLGVVALAAAQDHMNSSPAGGGEKEKLVTTAVMQASSALKMGKAVTITVDNRSVSYVPKLIKGMVYVPIRLFQETGQQVSWDPKTMRATLQSINGTQKASVVFDMSASRAANRPTPSMRPVYEKGGVWVPLAGGLAPFGHLVEWVATSNRLNIRTNRLP